MYGDGDLSLTSTPLVDERVPSTQAYADDLHPVSSMPPPPVPKRTFTGVQRSSVDSGVVAGGSLNRADSTRACASLMGSTANFGAEQGEQVGQTVVSDTHVAITASVLLWVRVDGFKTHQESCFVTTSLRPHPRSVGPRVRPGTYEIPRPTGHRLRCQAVYDPAETLAHFKRPQCWHVISPSWTMLPSKAVCSLMISIRVTPTSAVPSVSTSKQITVGAAVIEVSTTIVLSTSWMDRCCCLPSQTRCPSSWASALPLTLRVGAQALLPDAGAQTVLAR